MSEQHRVTISQEGNFQQPKIDFIVYQGIDFNYTFLIGEGIAYPISSVSPGSSTEIEVEFDHNIVAGDYVGLSGINTLPSLLSDSYDVDSVTANTLTINTSTSKVISSKGGSVQKLIDLSLYSFSGEIHQKADESIKNVLASTSGSSREVVLSGVTSLQSGSIIKFPNKNNTAYSVNQVRTISGGRQILVLDQQVSLNNEILEFSSDSLGDLILTNDTPTEGKIIAKVEDTVSSSIPPGNYAYDIKYGISDGGTPATIESTGLLCYGDVKVISQVESIPTIP